MSEHELLQHHLMLGALLFGLGMIGFVVRRNMIVMFLCVEMMLQGVAVTLIAYGRFHGDWGGQVLVIFIIAVAACEAGIALALILAVARSSGSLDIAKWQNAREEGLPRYVDQEIAEPCRPETAWPSLTPAGVEPEQPSQEHQHRSRV